MQEKFDALLAEVPTDVVETPRTPPRSPIAPTAPLVAPTVVKTELTTETSGDAGPLAGLDAADAKLALEMAMGQVARLQALLKTQASVSAAASSRPSAATAAPSAPPPTAPTSTVAPSAPPLVNSAPHHATSVKDEASAPALAPENNETLLPKNPDAPSMTSLDLPAGVAVHQFHNPEERAKAWARYNRSLLDGPSRAGIDPTKQRAKRQSKVPPHILSQLAGSAEKEFYFQIWMSCESSWAEVEAFEEHWKENRTIGLEKEAWMTDAQMLQVWRDQMVVDQLKLWASKQTDRPRVRLNPKIPDCAAATQYLVQVEESTTTQVEEVLRKGIRMRFDLEGEGGQAVARSHVARSANTFGHGPMACASDASGGKLADALPLQGMKRNASEAGLEAVSGPGDLRRRQLLEKLEKDEAGKQRKADEKRQKQKEQQEVKRMKIQEEKEARQAVSKTPEGRARTWVGGLQDHISKADVELVACKSPQCPLPAGLARECRVSPAQGSLYNGVHCIYIYIYIYICK